MQTKDILSTSELTQIKAYADLIDSVLSRARTQGVQGDVIESINRMKHHTLEIVGEIEYVQSEIDAEADEENTAQEDDCDGITNEEACEAPVRRTSPAAKDTRDPRDVRSIRKGIVALHDANRK